MKLQTPVHGRTGLMLLCSAALLFGIALRALLLISRQPFFDELFTLWLTRHSPADAFSALRLDSGPPLYYMAVKLLWLFVEPSVTAARLLSMLFGVAAIAILYSAEELGNMRAAAMLFLATFPPHVYFSTEARGYALAALMIGAATLWISRWIEQGRGRDLALSTAALVAGSYVHYYCALFLPVPLSLALIARDGARIRQAIRSTVASLVVFSPGIVLALSQPRNSMRWMGGWGAWPAGAGSLASMFANLGWAGNFPEVFAGPGRSWLRPASIGLTLLIFLLACRVPFGRRVAALLLIPLAGCCMLALAGIPLYFPMRFEAVLSVPFCLLAAAALVPLTNFPRMGLLTVSVVLALSGSYSAILANASRPSDPYRSAALMLHDRVPGNGVIVASGYLYLEVAALRDEQWQPHVIAFPRSQGLHPGWRSAESEASLREEARALREKLPAGFFWAGESRSSERREIFKAIPLELVWKNALVEVARGRGGRSGASP